MQPIFKVGDRVFWDKRGWGTIKHIGIDPDNEYLIEVKFDNKKASISFTLAGYYHEDDLVPSLSFTEYEIDSLLPGTPPSRSKTRRSHMGQK